MVDKIIVIIFVVVAVVVDIYQPLLLLPLHKIWGHKVCSNLFCFIVGNAYQLSQLIRTLLDPENMALGANVSPFFDR